MLGWLRGLRAPVMMWCKQAYQGVNRGRPTGGWRTARAAA